MLISFIIGFMAEQNGLLMVFFAMTLIVAFAPLGLAWVLAPKKPSARKRESYESGLQTFGKTWVEFKPQYYLYALAYVVFGVESVLLLPWAVAYAFLPFYAVIEATLFLLLLCFGLIYVWKKGWLHWM